MKAMISKSGILIVHPQNMTESFALEQWFKSKWLMRVADCVLNEEDIDLTELDIKEGE